MSEMLNVLRAPNRDGTLGLNVELYVMSTNGMNRMGTSSLYQDQLTYQDAYWQPTSDMSDWVPWSGSMNLAQMNPGNPGAIVAPFMRRREFMPYYGNSGGVKSWMKSTFSVDMSSNSFEAEKNQAYQAITQIGTNGADVEQGICTLNRTVHIEGANALFKQGDKAAFVVLSDEKDQSDINTCIVRNEDRCTKKPDVPITITSNNCTGADCTRIDYKVRWTYAENGPRYRMSYRYNTTIQANQGRVYYKLQVNYWLKYLTLDGRPVPDQFASADMRSDDTLIATVSASACDAATLSGYRASYDEAAVRQVLAGKGIMDPLKVTYAVNCYDKESTPSIASSTKIVHQHNGAFSYANNQSACTVSRACDTTEQNAIQAWMNSNKPNAFLDFGPNTCELCADLPVADPSLSGATVDTYSDTSNKAGDLCNSSFSAGGKTYANVGEYVFNAHSSGGYYKINIGSCQRVPILQTPSTQPGGYACAHTDTNLNSEYRGDISTDKLTDVFLHRSRDLFGDKGFFVSAITHDQTLNPADCTLQPGQSWGTNYQNLVALSPGGGAKTSICNSNYAPALEPLRKFISDTLYLSYHVSLADDEVIARVRIRRNDTLIVPVAGIQFTVIGGSIQFVEGVLQENDTLVIDIATVKSY